MNKFAKKKRGENQAGMTLLEVAIALAIAGVILASTIALYSGAQRQRKIQITHERMDAIVLALSVYAETAGRIPCPANPGMSDITFGWEYGISSADMQVARAAASFPIGSCGAGNPTVGLLPFMTLSIPVEMMKDGWGNYFTYAVSPVFTRPNDKADSTGGPDSGTVHGRCRHAGWNDPNDKYNRNTVKARFCCADQSAPTYDAGSDLVIRHTADNSLLLNPPRALAATPSTVTGGSVYDQIKKITTQSGTTIPAFETAPVEAPAFVLVSHGPDGLGAYLGNGTLNKNGAPGGVEGENSNSDQTFVDGPWNLTNGGANYFDDIVRWLTQDGILAAHGALSCQYP